MLLFHQTVFAKLSQEYDSFIGKQMTLFWVNPEMNAQKLIFNINTQFSCVNF